MSDERMHPSEEDPRERFRRLLSEVEEEEEKNSQDKTRPVDVSAGPAQDGHTGDPGTSHDGRSSDGETGKAGEEAPGQSPDGDHSDDLGATRPMRPDAGDRQPGSGKTGPVQAGSARAGDGPAQGMDGRTMASHPGSGTGGRRPGSGANEPTPPPRGAPALDPYGFPLPRRVNEIDVDATRVTPAAYSTPAGRARGAARRPGPPPSPPAPPAAAKRRKGRARAFNLNRTMGCLLRLTLVGLFVAVLGLLAGLSVLFFQYYRIAATLPDINDLRQRASQFETTRILDRNGSSLYEILDPTAGRRTYVPLERISPYLVAATIATEDREFYSHPGVDLVAILRAFWQNYQSGETVSGASTITQQLARTLLLDPEERVEKSYERKIREAILATEITRRYSKDEILELYLNEIYYGNLAYGVQAAAETYFGTTADQLTLGQAAFLAGLPQAPSVYDVYNNRDVTLARMEDVLVLMFEASQVQNCIYVSNYEERLCMDPVALTTAATEIRNYEFNAPGVQMRYPHWVNFVRSLLEAQFDSQTIYRSGFTVYTTLDPELQDLAQQMVSEQVASMADRNASDGALVAIRPATGEVLAMVGSADFYNEDISGQVNMAVSPRQPGSSIKPLTYVAAFEKGWTPATLLWDVPSEFSPSGRPDNFSEPYVPVNYDDRFHGPVTVRSALGNSYNIPAVKALEFVGIYDDPATPQEDGLLALARRVGITTLTRPDYGLSLTLGGGDVSLLELTNFYATLANNGRRMPPIAITRILDYQGNVVYDYQQPPGEQVVRPEHAYLISSILSDNEARTPAFGQNSALNLPFTAAAKTGTTNDYRDNWTLGYTPDLAVGAWVGNADYTPMQNTSGLTGAAPIWSQFMQAAMPVVTDGNPTDFSRPAGIVERVICEISGTEPSEWCPGQRTEIFAVDQPPLPKEEDLWQRVYLDTWTGLRASVACGDYIDEEFVLKVDDPWARNWLTSNPQGEAWAEEMGFDRPIRFAPDRECAETDPRPKLDFAHLRDHETILTSPLEIYGTVDATAWFDQWVLEYGIGEDPVDWEVLEADDRPVPQPDLLYSWDMIDEIGDELPAGIITLRLTLYSTEDSYAEKLIRVNLQVPTPTPTPTETPTPTPTPTETPTPTQTPTITPTLPPTETPTPEPTATQVKVPKATTPPEPTEPVETPSVAQPTNIVP